MHTAAQAYDLIFAAETNPGRRPGPDRRRRRGRKRLFRNGFCPGFRAGRPKSRVTPEIREYLDSTGWKVRIEGNLDDFYSGTKPLITFTRLANASRGTAFSPCKPTGTACCGASLCWSGMKTGSIPAFPFGSFAIRFRSRRLCLPRRATARRRLGREGLLQAFRLLDLGWLPVHGPRGPSRHHRSPLPPEDQGRSYRTGVIL